MIKHKIIEVPLYNSNVICYAGPGDEVMKYHRKKYKINLDIDSNQYDGLSFDLEGSGTILWLRSINNVPDLSHELVHIVYYLMEKVGMPLSNNSQEAYAYLTGYLMEQWLDSKGWKSTKKEVSK